ncbi:MAG: cation transporter [Ruminiclostridium sp.]|nr:cation transporter [Ruminiclostridium sp.]
MTKENKSGSRTLLMSVLMSSPGPIVVGLGLLMGKSSTQLADFVRRSAELLAIIMAFVVYRMTNKEGQSEDHIRKARLERFSNLFVGTVMCLSGASMLLIALFAPSTEKGNVIPGLTIAILGVIANTLFWRKYTKLSRQGGNAILAVQARLYRAKSLVDTCVTIALLTVALFPRSAAAIWLDIGGSVVVSVYLIWCGIKTIREQKTAP